MRDKQRVWNQLDVGVVWLSSRGKHHPDSFTNNTLPGVTSYSERQMALMIHYQVKQEIQFKNNIKLLYFDERQTNTFL